MNEESEKNSSNAAASGTAVATNMKQPKSQVALDMIEDDEERHERANYRWKLAITIVMKINRSICVFSKAIGPEKNQEQQITNAANFSENSFTYMLRSFHSTSDIITNTRVQMLVKVNPEDRTIEAIQSLERFLRPRIGVFAKYNLAHRISICQQMKVI